MWLRFLLIVSVNSCWCGPWPDKSVKKVVCVTLKGSITYSVQPWCMSMRRQRFFKHCQISVQMKWGGGGIRSSQKCCSQYCFIELISCCVERIHAVVHLVADSGSLFSLYMLPLSQIMRRNQIAYHSYADDTQIYLALSPNDYSPIDSLCQCIDEINSWMCQNFLQLNKEKTEVIAFGNKDEVLKVNAYLDSRGQTTKNQVRNLGAILETDLSFSIIVMSKQYLNQHTIISKTLHKLDVLFPVKIWRNLFMPLSPAGWIIVMVSSPAFQRRPLDSCKDSE